MAWPKTGSARGRRILEDDYDDDEDDDAPMAGVGGGSSGGGAGAGGGRGRGGGRGGGLPSDEDDDDEDDDEGEYEDDEDADADGDVEMFSPEQGGDDEEDDEEEDEDDDGQGEEYDEDEDADGEGDDDGDGEDDDDEEDGGDDDDEEDEDADGDDDDLDADGDADDIDAEGEDDDEDEDEEDEDDAEDTATPATTKADTPAPARSEISLATPSKPPVSQRQRVPTGTAHAAEESPLRTSTRAGGLDENYDDDDEEDKEARADPVGPPPKPIRYGKYAPETYVERTKARLSAIRPAEDIFVANSYIIEPSAAAPHVAHVHGFAMSADSTVLLTGGSDGYVRSYDLYKTMNGRQMLTQSVRHAYVEGVVRAGVMTHFWGNDEVPRKMNPALITDELPVSAVHSLACQRDALWGLSGTESGNINLFTVRHASGKIQHVLRRHKAPVSVLALADGDKTLISGSWDRGVHQWDLDTGKVVRSYPGHAGHVSSLSFRPIQQGTRHKRRRTSPGQHRAHDDSSRTLLNDPDTQISISIQAPNAPEADRAEDADEKMDTDGSSGNLATAAPEETSQAEAKGEAQGKGPMSGDVDGKPSPPAAPPDKELETKQIATGSEGGLGLSLDKDGRHTAAAANGSDKAEGDGAKAGAPPGQDDDNDSLFGGSDDEAAQEGAANGPTKPTAGLGPDADADADADGDADADADGDADADADGEADADADGDDDQDADADDDDQPLFTVTQRERAAGIGTPSASTIGLPAGSALARTQSSASLMNTGSPALHGGSLLLPANGTGTGSPGGAVLGGSATPALPSSQTLPPVAPDLNAPQPPPKPRTQTSHLPKPAFGPATAMRGFSDDVSTFSDDILLSTTLAGQVLLWDRRVKSGNGAGGPVGILANGHANTLGISGPQAAHVNGNSASGANGSSTALQRTLSGLSGNWMMGPSSSSMTPYENGRGVRALALPDKTPPWCAAACWSAYGDRIYVGRRNETVDEWDLRMVQGGKAGEVDAELRDDAGLAYHGKQNPRFVRSLKLPVGSGSVSALCAMPNGRHIVCGSFDNVRLWDTEATGAGMPFRIVAGHHGGFVSQMGVDATARFLLVASGDRGWLSGSTEAVLIHEIHTQ
ncbi:Transcription factor spt8 [Tilletia horrida]|nr:Transcription factor spt8 [Tilletia horrida]